MLEKSTPKIITFLTLVIFPMLKSLPSSKHIPYPSYLFLELSEAFLITFIAPNKAF